MMRKKEAFSRLQLLGQNMIYSCRHIECNKPQTFKEEYSVHRLTDRVGQEHITLA